MARLGRTRFMRFIRCIRAAALCMAFAEMFIACSSKKDKTSCDADLSFDNMSCSGACTANYSSCELEQKNEFPISGTYTITDCSYEATSPENSNYMNLPCKGAITLCITGLHNSVEVMTYQDIGPSGSATGSSFKVYGSSCINCDPGSTTPQTFDVIGTDTVQGANGCTEQVDIWLHCFGSLPDNTWTCRKTSAVRSSTCGDSGWIRSFGHYKHTNTGCGSAPKDDAGTTGEGGTGPKPNGSTCTSAADCASGKCIDSSTLGYRVCSCDDSGHSVCPCKSAGSSCSDDAQCCTLSCGINTDGQCD